MIHNITHPTKYTEGVPYSIDHMHLIQTVEIWQSFPDFLIVFKSVYV